jgi:cytochrome c oxidase assembly protein subunit 15
LLIQLYIIYRLKPSEVQKILLPKMDFYIWWFIFGISFYQMFLGTQVREYIDALSKAGLGRETWSDHFGMAFFIHRSFSWMVLALLVIITWRNEKQSKISIIRYAIIVLGFELFAGVLLAYFDMPGLVQTAHLVFASILLGILGMGIFRFRKIQ